MSEEIEAQQQQLDPLFSTNPVSTDDTEKAVDNIVKTVESSPELSSALESRLLEYIDCNELLHQCAWCQKIMNKETKDYEELIGFTNLGKKKQEEIVCNLGKNISHGICPCCTEDLL